jgi:hypothetical protein
VPPYDTTQIGLPKEHRAWSMVRTFIVANKQSPAYGVRNAFFNATALEALQKGGMTYPDGAEIAMTIHEIVDGEGGRQTQGPLRGTFLMMRDGKKFSATDGWGYARFNAKGEPVKVNPLKNCHECHMGVEKTTTRGSPRAVSFTRGWRLRRRNG